MTFSVHRIACCAAMALAVAGCSHSSTTTTDTATGASSPAASAGAGSTDASGTGGASAAGSPSAVAASAAGDAGHGKQVFSANCTGCHGATGTEGGVGPSLKGERTRKNQAQAVAWIKNPAPPMPKLYPSPLSAGDVNDVAAYVESL